MTPIHIRCPHCCGKGCIPLTGVYADTLALLRAQPDEVTGIDMARLDGCTGPAMNNRLAVLEGYGLVASRRYGRKRLYRAVELKP